MLSKAKQVASEDSLPENRLSQEEEMDQEIATAVLTNTFLGGEGEEGLVRALQSPEPAKALAIQIFGVIEATQLESMDTDTPISPRVWLAQGGAVDDFLGDVAEVGDRYGVSEEDIVSLMPAVRSELVTLIESRGRDLASQTQAPQQGPPPQAPLPGGGNPIGGM